MFLDIAIYTSKPVFIRIVPKHKTVCADITVYNRVVILWVNVCRYLGISINHLFISSKLFNIHI